MRDILADIVRWKEENKAVALATVVKVYGSAPRPLGAKMAVSAAGEMVGSVSGGCVEGAVVQEALAVLEEGRPRLLRFGISDEQAWDVGLACGGTIEVFVERAFPTSGDDPWDAVVQSVAREEAVALATLLAGESKGRKLALWPDGRTLGSLGDAALDAAVAARARALFRAQRSERVTLTVAETPYDVLIDVFPPPPQLVIVGAVHIAIPLVTFARTLGFRTVVVDARRVFATRERFPHVDELLIGWPQDILPRLRLDESTYVVVLSHDEKLDNPALKVALEHPVRYVGALGSRKTHARRVAALRAMGVAEDAIARIHAPIGRDIGARTPEEIAVAIMAEIVAARRGG